VEGIFVIHANHRAGKRLLFAFIFHKSVCGLLRNDSTAEGSIVTISSGFDHKALIFLIVFGITNKLFAFCTLSIIS
jgi:hypothetical protein